MVNGEEKVPQSKGEEAVDRKESKKKQLDEESHLSSKHRLEDALQVDSIVN